MQQQTAIKIWGFVNNILREFAREFNNDKAYQWFVVVVIGLMIRTEHLGVTSIIRELYIAPSSYESMLLFFRANSWALTKIKIKWMEIVVLCGIIYRESGMADLAVMIGDGTKVGKAGEKMPGVKKMKQESEDNTKKKYFFGYLYGALGILTGTAEKMFCSPISLSIQDGVSIIREWEDKTYEQASHVTQMIKDACAAVATVGSSVLLLDRYYLSVPALLAIKKYLGKDQILHIVTRAKQNATAYFKPIAPSKPTRGAPRKKGKKVKVWDFFNDTQKFTNKTLTIYGKKENVRYYCIDLLWGKKLYQELRFVCVCYGDEKAILVSTNLAFSPEQIIKLYSLRQKIEVSFFGLKQVIYGFASHFWSKSTPELDRYMKKDAVNPLASVTDPRERKNIIGALKATEGFAMFSCIALGLLQIISLKFHDITNPRSIRWLRTYSNEISSEATIAHFMRNSIFSMFQKLHNLPIMQIIRNKQSANFIENEAVSDDTA